MEAAYTPAYAELIQTPAIPAGESPYISGPENGQDQTDQIDESGGGNPVSFREILSGLLRKNGTDDGGEDYGGGVRLDEMTLFEAEVPSAADMLAGIPFDADAPAGEERLAGFARNQGRISGKTESADEPEKAEKMVKSGRSGAIEAELSALDFSEEDKNILLSVLLNRSTGQIPIDGEEAPVGEIRLEAGPGGESADFAALFEGQAETAGTGQPAAGTAELTELAEGLKARRFDNGGSEARSGDRSGEAAELAGFAPDAVQPEQAAPQGNGGEKESRSRPGEVRGREGRRDRLSFELRDLRKGGAGEGIKSESLQLKASAETRIQGESGNREITLELRLPNQSRNTPATEAVRETNAGRAFEDLLARELHQNFNSDIVRHASMVLRDEGRGSIRLALKPETLGNVKIRLEMAENKITGHIVVESEEAMRAFEKEIRSLEQSFKESGFQSANLEMSLAADGRRADQGRQEPGANPFLPGSMAAFRYNTALERAEMPLPDILDVYRRHTASVNVLA
jgi:hypothetical protein